jgi:AraC family ethanolamine operon transcriptional activator
LIQVKERAHGSDAGYGCFVGRWHRRRHERQRPGSADATTVDGSMSAWQAGAAGDEAPCFALRVHTSDIEEQAASLRDWSQVYEQLSPGRFVGTVHEVRFRGIQLFRETTSQSVHQAGAPGSGMRAIGVPVHLAGSALFRGEPVDAQTLLSVRDADDLDFYAPREFDIVGVGIDERVLADYATRIEHRDAADLFGGRRVIRPGAARVEALRRLLTSALASLDVNPAALALQPAQRMLEQSVLATVLAAAAEGDEPPGRLVVCPNRRYLVEQAKAYMRAHIDEPIAVSDLCLNLNVSRRTLQYSFQQVLALNPVRLLRAMRLNGVRRDLTASDRATVQDVAARWGFWHLGHFVTDYKGMFGELPSQTLKRRNRFTLGVNAQEGGGSA